MSDLKPLIIVEPGVVQIVDKVALGYSCQALPRNGSFDSSDFSARTVILWPDASPDSIGAFKRFARQINDLCAEIKLILPTGRAYGWNIAYAVAEGMTWADLALWAKGSMMTFSKGEFPVLEVETRPAPDPTPASVHALWEKLGLAMGPNDSPITNIDNVVRILAGWDPFRHILWFDEFYGRYFTTWNGSRQREWQDIDDINFTILLQREFGLPRLSVETVSAAIRCRGYQCPKNEPKDWMHGLRWDGRPRVDAFFVRYLGAFENGYTLAVGRNFWLGMVARIYQAGCQLDNMVILEGKQGIYKSKALEAIGQKWYMESSEEITSKDFFCSLEGKLLVEIADLDSFSRADTNRIKKVITCRTDRYRVPYGRATEDHPRRCIFVGTTNERHYLRDSTGARRFWPIQCGHVNIDAIRGDREQLFGEAVSRYLANEDWYRVPEVLTASEQEERRQYDEWENMVALYIAESQRSELTIAEIGAYVGVDKGHLDIGIQRRLGAILRRFGWLPKTRRVGDFLQRIWTLNSPEPALEAQDQSLSSSPTQSSPAKA